MRSSLKAVARAGADSERRQLHETISALRDQLEQAAETTRQDVYEAKRTARYELEQHRGTIRELRARLEAQEDGAR